MLPPLRLTTNGLVQSPETVVDKLKDAGIQSLSVALMTADRTQYDELMTPMIPDGHEKVCKFIDVAIKAGLDVETTAVDRPDVDKKKAEDLARDMNVPESIRWRPFFP
jgi:molybdenum cofactor biosynthesis enzyme MoaA